MGNQEYQLKKPAVQCPYCERWFKHQGYFIRHDRDSIVSCATKKRIAENDKIIKDKFKEEVKNRPSNYYRQRWYEKNRDKILKDKKQWYIENKDKVKERYEYNKNNNEDSKDNVKKYNKKYYDKNRDKILQDKKQRYINNKPN
tara:strand:+ start:67 stop:495 length:429 start_codon:yes stop_codon:yes gene_type:complete